MRPYRITVIADKFPTELIGKLMDGQDETAMSILNQLGYFDALDRANAEAASEPNGSATAMQSA